MAYPRVPWVTTVACGRQPPSFAATVKTIAEPKAISTYEPNPDFAEIDPGYLRKEDWKLQYA
jgi:hypothetical protein